MFYFINRQFPGTAKLLAVLVKTYGINQARVFFLLKRFGIPANFTLASLGKKKRTVLAKYVQTHFLIEKKLGRTLNQLLNDQLRLGNYRGLRMKQGLPARGQRTHTNAATAHKMQAFWQSLLKKKK
jgi:small subunit ribosomal protein S13